MRVLQKKMFTNRGVLGGFRIFRNSMVGDDDDHVVKISNLVGVFLFA